MKKYILPHFNTGVLLTDNYTHFCHCNTFKTQNLNNFTNMFQKSGKDLNVLLNTGLQCYITVINKNS